MQIDLLNVIRQMMAVYNVDVIEVKAPYDEIVMNDYFLLRKLLKTDGDWNKSVKNHLKRLSFHQVTMIEDFLGVCHIIFFVPDSMNCLIIGPYRTEIKKEKEMATLGMDADQIAHLKEALVLVPLIDEKIITMNLIPVISLGFEVGHFDVHHIVETAPKVFLPNKELFMTKQIGVEERMRMLEERYRVENEVLTAIGDGNAAKALEWLGKMKGREVATRFSVSLRSQKNSLIIFNSLMRKSIERAGVHPYYIDEISTRYSNMIEMIMGDEEYFIMMKMMTQEYCEYVLKYGKNQYSSVIQKVVAIINEDLSENYTLQRIAEQLNLNSSYLSALFKKETGMTLTYYIYHQKMRTAAELLKSTQGSIAQIAQSVGMLDVNYFARVFKKQMGISPSEYRKQK